MGVDRLEPLPSRRAKYNWYGIAEAAKQKRGQWILAGSGILRAHAHQIRSGQKRAFRDADGNVPFEVATRGRGPRADLYVAYIGPPVKKQKEVKDGTPDLAEA